MLDVIDRERPVGVIVQFGGQTAINLAEPLADRHSDLRHDGGRNQIRRRTGSGSGSCCGNSVFPSGREHRDVDSRSDGHRAKIRFPLVVRPSYVLGGRAMEIVHDEQELLEYMKYAVEVTPDHPVLVDRYVPGKELDVDAISDGQRVFIPGIMEHVERAGVHSGDSTAVFPPLGLTKDKSIKSSTTPVASLGLRIRGVINIQFVSA